MSSAILKQPFVAKAEEYHFIGNSQKRVEDARLLSGEGTFIADLNPFPRILHAAILRSPYPHAIIKKIYMREPEKKLKGIAAIITGKELAEVLRPFPVGVKANFDYYPIAVEVDIRTGKIKILDYVTVHDAGRLLNPMLADGQILGGAVHGLGGAMLEELAYSEGGEFLSGTFMDYMCPLSTDIPNFRILHMENLSPLTPLGTKGLGEGNTMSTPAAIAIAVTDALAPLGVEINELPITPAKLWKLIQSGAKR